MSGTLDLVVVNPFGPYNSGDLITDTPTIVAVLASNSDDVVQIEQAAGAPTAIPPPPDTPPPPPPLVPGDFVLIVVTPFGNYNRGDMISDPSTITTVMATNPDSVVQSY